MAPLKNSVPLTDGAPCEAAVDEQGDPESAEALLNSSRNPGCSSAGGNTERMDEARDDIELNDPRHNSTEPPFVGLTREDLQRYANDPFWKRVRLILLILFWVVWLGMLAAAIGIVIVAPKCPPRPDLDWWQSSVIYQVYPRSYKDAKARDGNGDLQGKDT